MTFTELCAFVIGIPVLGLICWFGWQAVRANRQADAIEAEEQEMAAELKTDAIDDGLAHELARARDGGV